MALEHGEYLWLLLTIPCFAVWSWLSHRASRDLLFRFARVKKKPLPHALTTLFLCLALGALILSLAEPKRQYTKTVFNRSGIDVVIGIDVSKSMLAEDEALPEDGKKLFAIPNRLNRARYCALNIISALKGERTGIFMFASKGVTVVPLTNDYGYCQYIIKHVNDATITIPGSDLGQAVDTGVSYFEGEPRKTVRTIILISDGEDISDDKAAALEAARRAAMQGVNVYTIAIGGSRQVLIPVRNADATAIEDYYRDEEGGYLRTAMSTEPLKSIATATGGSFFRGHDERSAEGIVEAMLKRARTVEYTRATEPAWYPLSPILLCAAFFSLAVALLIRR